MYLDWHSPAIVYCIIQPDFTLWAFNVDITFYLQVKLLTFGGHRKSHLPTYSPPSTYPFKIWMWFFYRYLSYRDGIEEFPWPFLSACLSGKTLGHPSYCWGGFKSIIVKTCLNPETRELVQCFVLSIFDYLLLPFSFWGCICLLTRL